MPSDPGSTPDSDFPADSPEHLGRTNILVREIRAGKHGSFSELFDRVMPALFAWVELRVRRAPRGVDPQDVLQEVWLRALQRFHTYDARLSFRAWIFGIAKNVLMSLHQKRREATLSARGAGSSSESLAPDVADTVTSIVTRLAKDDSLRALLGVVDQLTADERSLLLYLGIEGYTCAQVAQRLKITPDATSKRWQTLRAKLRERSSVEALAKVLID